MAQAPPASDLTRVRCQPCEGGVPPLNEEQIAPYKERVPQWERADHAIERTFKFKSYYEVIAFVNAVAWIAHTQNHHPDMEVGFNACKVRYTTHAIGGLSSNDFICAAKVDALFPEYSN